MVKVEKKDNIITFKGHSGYDTYGKDIVCSAISTLVITTINAILKVGGKAKQNYKDDTLTVKYENEELTNKLIENMIDMLKELKEQYPKNIGGKF